MKKIKNLLLVILFIWSLSACKEATLDLYESTSSIYFPSSENNDGVFVSLGYVSIFKQDSIVSFTIRTTGAAVDHDRPFNMVVSEESTMREGIDYEFVNSDFVMPAGRLTTSIRIRILRNEAMKEQELALFLELLPNEYFSTEVYNRVVGTGINQQTRYYTKRYLKVDDIVGAPVFWNSSISNSYLGPYSDAKFQLLISYFELDVEEITASTYRPAVVLLGVWAGALKVYLTEMNAKGTPVLEANGERMNLGGSYKITWPN